MKTLNNYQINMGSQLGLDFHCELLDEKKSYSVMRANVFLTAAMLGTASLAQASSDKYNLRISQDYRVESLRSSEIVTSELSAYVNKLKKVSVKKLTKFQIFEEILSFKSLENSWDGYNAKPLGIKCASNAFKLLDSIGESELNKISDFYPNPNGTISFEWENDNDEIVSLEIGKDTFSYYVSFNSVDTKYFNKQKIDSGDISIFQKFILSV
jgi:hypothetical protein